MAHRKAFTLLELLIASTLFVVTLIGIITIVTTVVASARQSLAERTVNSALRNINNKMMDMVGNSKCIKAEGEDTIVLYTDNCTNKSGKIVYRDKGLVVSDLNNETMLNPANIAVVSLKNQPIWKINGSNLLEMKIVLRLLSDTTENSIQYQSSYITGM